MPQLLLNAYNQYWTCSHTSCFLGQQHLFTHHWPQSSHPLKDNVTVLFLVHVFLVQECVSIHACVCGTYLSTIRSKVRLRRQSVRPFSPSSTSRPQGTQGNIITRGGPSLRRRPAYVPNPGDRGMEGEGGWGPQTNKKSQL